jgi:CRP/FNR family cyclic AMP-dependent transcriptional regulator
MNDSSHEVFKMIVSAEEFRNRFPALAVDASVEELSALINAMVLNHVPAGEILVRDGEPANSLYFLWEGRMVAFIEADNVSIELGHIQPGATIGEVAVLDPGPATATVKAEVDSTVLTLSPEGLHSLDQSHPTMCSKLLRMLSQLLVERLSEADELLMRHRQTTGAKGSESASRQRGKWPTNVYRKLFGHRESTA